MKTIYVAEVTSRGGRHGRIESSDGFLDMELALVDGTGRSPNKIGANPEQLFAGAYAACFESSLLGIAAARKIHIKHSAVQCRVALNKGSDGFFLSVELSITLEGASADERAILVENAHDICPYSKAIAGNVIVTMN